MTSVCSAPWSVISLSARISCLLFSAFCLMACSLPNLEEAECTQARGVVREFYSFHFGNDMRPTADNVRSREKFLTRSFAGKLFVDAADNSSRTRDFFTGTEDYPKAFRVGECRVIEPGKKVQFDVLLFWKDDTRTEQKRIYAEVEKENENWLLNFVGPMDLND